MRFAKLQSNASPVTKIHSQRAMIQQIGEDLRISSALISNSVNIDKYCALRSLGPSGLLSRGPQVWHRRCGRTVIHVPSIPGPDDRRQTAPALR